MAPMRARSRRFVPSGRVFAPAIFVAAFAVLVWHASLYWPLYVDDGYISLRYAERLLGGDGLTWTDGERVEGYSNLLWVLGCAALGALGVDLVVAGRALGMLGAALVMAAVIRAQRPRGFRDAGAALGAAGLTAICGPLVIWAVGGLEATLFTGLVLCAVVVVRELLLAGQSPTRGVLIASALFGLACLTRPDGLLLALTAAVAAFDQSASRKHGLRLALGLSSLPIACALGQLIFRLAYYGDWLPNTARAKVALGTPRALAGVQSALDAASSGWPLLLLALASFALYRGRRRPALLFTTSLALVWAAYTIVVASEDLGYRSLVPLFGILLLLAGDSLRRLRPPMAAAVALCTALAYGFSQSRDPNIAIADSRVPKLTTQAASIGRMLGRAFGERAPLLAVDAAGAIPYYAGLPALDMLGLNDAVLSRQRPEGMGAGLLGHELGSGDYVLSRAPDIIVPGVLGSATLAYRGGGELMRSAAFADAYRRVRLRGAAPERVVFHAWIRLDGPIGITRREGRIEVPAYLLADEASAGFDDAGRLGLTLGAGARGRLALRLPAGRWRITLEGEGPLATREALSLASPAMVTLEVTSAAGGAWLGGVTLIAEDATSAPASG